MLNRERGWQRVRWSRHLPVDFPPVADSTGAGLGAAGCGRSGEARGLWLGLVRGRLPRLGGAGPGVGLASLAPPRELRSRGIATEGLAGSDEAADVQLECLDQPLRDLSHLFLAEGPPALQDVSLG